MERHNIVGCCAQSPQCIVTQVIGVPVEKKQSAELMNKLDFGAILNIDKRLIYNALNGVIQITTVWQRGPFCKPSPATAVLYSPPITPTAANAMDKNI